MDILKKSIIHFKQLQFLSVEVSLSDFSLWEVLGTLPSLKHLTLKDYDPESYPAHAPEDSNSQSGLRYFGALESLCVTGSIFLIQHLLSFIDSPCLKSIEVYPFLNRGHNDSEHDHDDPGDLLTPFMTIVATKWSQALTDLTISSNPMAMARGFVNRDSKFLTLLTNLCEIRKFHLSGCTTENNDDAARCLAKSWPNLRSLALGVLRLPLNQTFVSLSTLRIIADNCPELHYLYIPLDISTIPHFDDFSSKKSPRHNLEFLVLGGPGGVQPLDQTMLECQIQVARNLDFIFPYLKTINVQNANWSGIRDLVILCQDIRRGQ